MSRKNVVTFGLVFLIVLGLGFYFLFPMKLGEYLDKADMIYISIHQPILEDGQADIQLQKYELEKNTAEYAEFLNLIQKKSYRRVWSSVIQSTLENGDVYILVNTENADIIISDTGEILIDGHKYVLWDKTDNLSQKIIDLLE